MSLERFDRIAQINAARWDRAVQRRAFAGHAWLAYGERVHQADRPVYHLAAGRDGRETGCVCWIRRREQLPVSSGWIRRFLDRFLSRNPLVTCQTAVAGLSGLFIGDAHGDLRSGLSGIVPALKEVLAEARGSFLIVPYLDPGTAAHPAWGDGFLSVAMPPNTYLPVMAPDFEAFIAGLRRNVRKDYRRHRNQALRLQLRTRISLRPPDREVVIRLVRAVERKHRSAPLPFLEALVAERPVPGGKWIVVERLADRKDEASGETVGCGLILRERGRLCLTALGLADNAPNVYFELMYRAIRNAVETRAEGIFGGGGAYRFKEKLGYRPTEDNRVLFYARNPRLRRLGAWLAGQEAVAGRDPVAFADGRLDDGLSAGGDGARLRLQVRFPL